MTHKDNNCFDFLIKYRLIFISVGMQYLCASKKYINEVLYSIYIFIAQRCGN